MVVPPDNTVATPHGQVSLENLVVTLTAYVDSADTIIDPAARIYFQRYAQSVPSVFDVAQRSNLAGFDPDAPSCIHVRYFDPDGIQTVLYHAPTECDPIAHPVLPTGDDLQLAYQNGDFSILIEGYDAVSDLGYGIKSMFHDDGTPIAFTEYLPGNIYIIPQIGMFMFFHFPDKWDSCSSWDFSWWDTSDPAFLIAYADTTLPPYVTDWNTLMPAPSTIPVYAPTNGGLPKFQAWDGQGGAPLPSPTSGFAQPMWGDVTNPIALNTYWDMVSEAPTIDAYIVTSYWTQDNANPLEPRGGGTPDEANAYRNELYTSPITLSTDTQIRFRSVTGINIIEDTKAEIYTVGLRFTLEQGVNLISQPYITSGPEADLGNIFTGLNLLQIFRLDNGLWRVYSPSLPDVSKDFTDIDNTHGLFVIMNSPGTFCFPYGTDPVNTTLTLVDKNTNQGISAIGVPRSSLQDNSISNLLESRNIQFDQIQRVTNGIFETYILNRSPILNFSPVDLTPGRGYGVTASRAQIFELPFID
jgi:hypothetical protein